MSTAPEWIVDIKLNKTIIKVIVRTSQSYLNMECVKEQLCIKDINLGYE
jgi:hypothetical protein